VISSLIAPNDKKELIKIMADITTKLSVVAGSESECWGETGVRLQQATQEAEA